MGIVGNTEEILAAVAMNDTDTADSSIIEQVDLATYLLILTLSSETPAASVQLTIDALDKVGAVLKAGYIDLSGSPLTVVGTTIYSFGPHADAGPAGITAAQACIMPSRWRVHLLQAGDAPSVITAQLRIQRFFVAPIA